MVNNTLMQSTLCTRPIPMTLMFQSLLNGGQTEVTTPMKSVRLCKSLFIYSRTAVFISTFYSRKSELFLKKGGVILSDLATRLHCIISSPGAISDCTARSFTCYCRFCVLQQLISVHFLMLINTSVNAFQRVAA